MNEKEPLRLKLKDKNRQVTGSVSLFWGMPNVGKTVNSCLSKNPTLFVPNGYDPEPHMKSMGLDVSNLQVVDLSEVDGWGEFKSIFLDKKTYDGFTNVVFDDFTYLVDNLLEEIGDESGRAEKSGGKKLAAEVKSTIEDYGVVYGQVMRFVKAIRVIAEETGVNFIFTAHANNEFDDEVYKQAPLFAGKKITIKSLGVFDIVGYVRPKTQAEAEKYPDCLLPMVEVKPYSKNMCKWRGDAKWTKGAHRFVLDDILARSYGTTETK